MALPPLSLTDALYLVNMARTRLDGTNVHRVDNKCLWVLWVSRSFSETGRLPDCVDPTTYAKDINELRRIAGL